jgi:hypothetical protein
LPIWAIKVLVLNVREGEERGGEKRGRVEGMLKTFDI